MASNKQQTAVDIKEELKSILGSDAFSLGNMQVSERVTKLVKAVKYMYVLLAVSAVLIIPLLLIAYGGIYLMLIRNQKKEEGNHNELINWYYNQVNKR
jgi:hypothetical protein